MFICLFEWKKKIKKKKKKFVYSTNFCPIIITNLNTRSLNRRKKIKHFSSRSKLLKNNFLLKMFIFLTR